MVCGQCTKYLLYLPKAQNEVHEANTDIDEEESICAKAFCQTFTFQVHSTDKPFLFALDGDSEYFLKLDPSSNIWESNRKISSLNSKRDIDKNKNVTFSEMWTEIAIWKSELSDAFSSLQDLHTSNTFLKAGIPITRTDLDRKSMGMRPAFAMDSVNRFVFPDGICRQNCYSI